MKLVNKAILLVSPERWGHIFVSKHHYAIHLGRASNKVFFLNPPSGELRILATGFSNVWQVDYEGFPLGLRYFPRLLRHYFIRKVYRRLAAVTKHDFDIIWSFDNSVFFDFKALPERVLSISHVVDLNQNFQTKRATESADVSLAVSDVIKKRLLNFRQDVFKINHGYASFGFNIPAVELPGENTIKIIYAGNLLIPYIDWALISLMVERRKEFDFIFIGPGSEKIEKEVSPSLCDKSNVFFIGKIASDLLGAYYRSASLLIVCYMEEFQRAQVANPHKVMEYLGSGKMIVATHTAEYVSLARKGLFLMSKNNSEYLALLTEAVMNLEYWNDVSLMEKRRSFALENTYQKQIGKIESLIRGR